MNSKRILDINYSYSNNLKKNNIMDIINSNKSTNTNKCTNTTNKKRKKNNDDNSSSGSEDNDNVLDSVLDKIGNLGNPMKKKHNDDTKIERDNNHIYFYSEVNRESIYDLCTLIKEAEEESILLSYKLNLEEIPIYIHISSFGGSIFAAFNAIDVINSCKVPIYTIIDGATASAGTLISIVAKKRFIRPNANMLIHQLSSGCWWKMSEIEDEYNNLKGLMDRIKQFYTNHTKIPKKELTNLLNHDLWLDSAKCIEYGLVDELWEK
jgi:ATP-dependent Clp endopeptidase proteolytic subunit ClpP